MARPFYLSWGAAPEASWAIDAGFLGAQGPAFRVVTIYSVPQAINASGGFARCKDASQHVLGDRVPC